MELDLIEFNKAIKTVLLAVEKVADANGYHCIVFEKDVIKSFNGWLGVTYSLLTGLSCTVEGYLLSKIVSSMRGDSITVEADDSFLTLKAGKTTARIPFADSPLSQTIMTYTSGDLVWHNVPDNFSKLIKSGIIPMHDESVGGIYVNGCDLIATNTKMIYYAKFDGQLDPFILSNNKAKEVSKHKINKVSYNRAFVFFRGGGITTYVRKGNDEDYPADMFLGAVRDYLIGEPLVEGPLPVGLEEISILGKDIGEGLLTLIATEDTLKVKINGDGNTIEDEFDSEFECTSECSLELESSMMSHAMKNAKIESLRVGDGYANRLALMLANEEQIYIIECAE